MGSNQLFVLYGSTRLGYFEGNYLFNPTSLIAKWRLRIATTKLTYVTLVHVTRCAPSRSKAGSDRKLQQGKRDEKGGGRMAPSVGSSTRRGPRGLPRDCVFSLQKAAGAVELLASLAPEGMSEKQLSKFVEVAQHPVKLWVAAIEPKGSGVVWNYETSELVAEFSLEVAQSLDDDADEGDGASAGAEAAAAVSSPTSSKGFLQLGSSSPTAVSYIKSSRRSTGLKMLFYDQEAIAATAQIPAPRTCFDEWLIVLAASGIVIYDLNQNSMVGDLYKSHSGFWIDPFP